MANAPVNAHSTTASEATIRLSLIRPNSTEAINMT